VAVLRSSSALALLFAACARPAQGPLPGDSDASYKPTVRAARIPPRVEKAWSEYEAVRAWSAASPAPFVSAGHPLAGAVEVHVSPESRAAYLGLVPDTVLPEGTLLAELPAHAGSGPGYAMRKTREAWIFFELDAQGALLASGPLPLCIGCHAQAPADGVFGLPRERSPAN